MENSGKGPSLPLIYPRKKWWHATLSHLSPSSIISLLPPLENFNKRNRGHTPSFVKGGACPKHSSKRSRDLAFHTRKSPIVYRFANEWQEKLDLASKYLEKAAEHMKKCWGLPITKRIGKVVYMVQLSPRLKVRLVFHASQLKPYHENMTSTAITSSYDKEDEYILTNRTVHRCRVPHNKEYLVKWKDLSDNEASWEHAVTLWQFEEQIQRFH
ncbi:hypothetical protein AMTRI_Chr04g248350 [Amborella trichopoda]